jgi:hypothetical protein
LSELEKLLNAALEEIKNLENNEIFLLKDLYKGYVWNRIPVKHRLILGTLFLEQIKKDNVSVEVIEKTSSKQQKYRKNNRIVIGNVNKNNK